MSSHNIGEACEDRINQGHGQTRPRNDRLKDEQHYEQENQWPENSVGENAIDAFTDSGFTVAPHFHRIRNDSLDHRVTPNQTGLMTRGIEIVDSFVGTPD